MDSRYHLKLAANLSYDWGPPLTRPVSLRNLGRIAPRTYNPPVKILHPPPGCNPYPTNRNIATDASRRRPMSFELPGPRARLLARR